MAAVTSSISLTAASTTASLRFWAYNAPILPTIESISLQ